MGCCNNFGFRHDRCFDSFGSFSCRFGRRRDFRRIYRRGQFYGDGYWRCSGRKCGFSDFNKFY